MTPANQLRPTLGSENADTVTRVSLRHYAAKPPCLTLAGARQTVPAAFFRDDDITEPGRLCGRLTLSDVTLFLPRGSDTDGRRSSSLSGESVTV